MQPRADLILANRAYLDHDAPPGGEEAPSPSGGGLLAAVRPVIAPWDGARGTTWIGPGRGAFDSEAVDERGFEFLETPAGMLRHRRLFFPAETWRAHYAGVANAFLWPLLHIVREPLPLRVSYYPRPLAPSEEEWCATQSVANTFAAAALEEPWAATCWIHDYQLGLVPAAMREQGFAGQTGFFLHTPFPDIAVAARCTDERGRAMFARWLRGVLGADVIGLQAPADVTRFRSAAAELTGVRATAEGLTIDDRPVRVAAYPVGIDSNEVIAGPWPASATGILRASRERGLPLVAGIEREDFTKGIPERLYAVERAYRAGARFAYLGIAAPTRWGVPGYGALAHAVAAAVEQASAAAREAGCPFAYRREAIPWPQVVALLREADVVFTSSLADGMNLVPLQAVAAQAGRAGDRAVILVGRDTGSAAALEDFSADGIVAIDPFDLKGMTAALIAALDGAPGRISDRLVAFVREHDASAWATAFLQDLEASRC